MQLLGEPSGRLEEDVARVAGAVVGDLHRSVLLDPQLAHDDVVHAAVDVAPGVHLVMAGEGGSRTSERVMQRNEAL